MSEKQKEDPLVTKNDDDEETRSRRCSPLRKLGTSLMVVSIIGVVLICLLYFTGVTPSDGSVHFLGATFVLFCFGALILLFESLWKSFKSGGEKNYAKRTALVLGSALFIVLTTMSLTLMILGLNIFCTDKFFLYNPDFGSCPCDSSRPLLRTEDEPVFTSERFADVTIATIGDSDLFKMRPVLEQIQAKNVDLLILNGDLNYQSDPQGLGELLSDVFGDDFPMLMTVGNHDNGILTQYQEVFQKKYNDYRLSVAGEQQASPESVLSCKGEIGVNQICSFRNLGLVLSGIGSGCIDDEELNANLLSQLQSMKEDGVVWRNVYIHKNQRLLQTGGKGDEVGFTAYEHSISLGATMMNSHEHQYARTKQLNSVGPKAEDFAVTSEDELEPQINNTEVVAISEGNGVLVLNGLGSKSLRGADEELASNFWWQKVYSENDEGATYGSHFCHYNVADESNRNLAKCFFEDLTRKVVDEYILLSKN